MNKQGLVIEFSLLMIALIVCLSLSGCANKKGIIKVTDKCIEFSGTRPFKAEYEETEDGRIKASFDMKGQPLINIGQIPDVALKN